MCDNGELKKKYIIFMPIHQYCLFFINSPLSLTISLFSFSPLNSPYLYIYLGKNLEPLVLRERCIMIRHFLVVCALKAYGT